MPQYFKQELFFRQLTGFYFLYPGTKGTPLSSKRDKTHSQQTQNTKSLDILCTSDDY